MGVTATEVAEWLRAFQVDVADHRNRLTALDAAIGDADHGVNMDRGMKAVVAKLDLLEQQQAADAGGILRAAGMTLVSTVGGASGPLYGTFFLRMGATSAALAEVDGATWTAAFDAGVKGIQERGRAELGDKTMLDALLPAAAALRAAIEHGASVSVALHKASVAAREGAQATIPLVARKGRASYLGERSAGHQDPGATSAYLLVNCAAATLGREGTGDDAESRSEERERSHGQVRSRN